MKRSGHIFQRTAGILSLVVLLVVCLTSGYCLAASLTILHTNDTHGHLLPFSYPSMNDFCSSLSDLQERKDIGGIARRAALVKQIRSELRKKGAPVWLVDAGDFSDGTPFSIEYHGEADVAAMNAAGYNFATLGNHEFNHTLAQLRKLVGLARYPVLCANVTIAATGEPLTQAYRVERVGPIRVGIFGLVTTDAASYPAGREGVIVADGIETARKVVAVLRSRADLIVLISHCGEDLDKKLASAVPGIDVIVGGHSHSRLPSGEFVWRSDDLMADRVNGTIIVQAHQWGGELGRCDLLFKKGRSGKWHVDRYRARLIPVTSAYPPDAGVAVVVDKYWGPVASRYEEIIGQAGGDFVSRGDDWAEYNLVTDAIRETFGTEVEFENQGGVRSPLIKGKITRGDMVNLDPFNNTIVTFKITGLQLGMSLESRLRPFQESAIGWRTENSQKLRSTASPSRTTVPIPERRIPILRTMVSKAWTLTIPENPG